MSLEKVYFDEARQSQLPLVELLLNMGYKYVSVASALHERGDDTSRFILSDIAASKLMEINSYEVDGVEFKFTEKDVRDALHDLVHVQYEGLISTSQEIYNVVMPTSGGKTIAINHKGKKISKNFKFIDFTDISKNDFHVTVEFSVTGKGTIRPDIVCFVNGIPFAIIENKKSSVKIDEAIGQINRYQSPEYCPKFFAYTQLLVATNGKDLQYGTTGTPNKFYAVWKEKGTTEEEMDKRVKELIAKPIDVDVYQQILKDLNGYTYNHTQSLNRLSTAQDRGVLSLFEPKRLLDLTKNYVLFDAGVKKLSRYQQYFAIRKMLDTISTYETTDQGVTKRKGGLVWHTQGSGKSLTMVMFVKALIENPDIVNPRVIIVTDRKDLDKQIKDTFHNCGLKKKVKQATSGENLLKMIKSKDLAVITTLVHKFESASKKKAGFVDTDQNLFVLVDEAHRSQYGDTAARMREIMKNACFIGFTGTPLLKKDKSLSKFGFTIDKYTIDDALEDNIILPLIYEGRYVVREQNSEQIDRRMDMVLEDMSEKYGAEKTNTKHNKYLQKQITASAIKNNPHGIEDIAQDIEKHYLNYFKDTGLKAQIVAPSKYAAVLFQKFFEKKEKINTKIVISDEKDDKDESNTHKQEVVAYLKKIEEKQSIEKYEKDVIDSFKNNEDGVEIVIVVSKLLTGFDAPRNTVLYLAKDLHDHELLQAIARVNRLYENKKIPKTAGFIIDYSENAKNIDSAMKLFGSYDEEDVKGTLIDVKDKISELKQNYSNVQDIFKEVKGSSDDEVYIRHLADEAKRELFYRGLTAFIKSLNECFVLRDFVDEFKELDIYRKDLKKLLELKKASKLLYATDVDLAEYKLAITHILDTYVDAKGIELLTKQVNITDKKQFAEAVEGLGSDKSKAEAIAAQTKKVISEREDNDPEFYERFSKKIEEILNQMHLGKLSDIETLKQMKLIEDDVLNKKDNELPEKIKAKAGADIFYRNLKDLSTGFGLDESGYVEMALHVYDIIKSEIIVDWQNNIDVKRKMKNALDDYFYDMSKDNQNLSISESVIIEAIEKIIDLARHNYTTL